MYKKTIVTQLRFYDTKNQKDRDIYVQPLTYVYNTQMHKTTIKVSFSLVLSRHSPGPATASQSSMLAPNSFVSTGPDLLRLIL